MKKYYALILLSMLLSLTACKQYENKQLIGTWKLAHIDYEFDETKHTPNMIQQIADAERMMEYIFLSDNEMNISTNGNSTKAYYNIDSTGVIRYCVFKDMRNALILGKYENGIINIKSLTMIGDINVQFERVSKKH